LSGTPALVVPLPVPHARSRAAFQAAENLVPPGKTQNGNPHYLGEFYEGVDGIAGLFFNKQITDGRQPSLITGHLHRAYHDCYF